MSSKFKVLAPLALVMIGAVAIYFGWKKEGSQTSPSTTSTATSANSASPVAPAKVAGSAPSATAVAPVTGTQPVTKTETSITGQAHQPSLTAQVQTPTQTQAQTKAQTQASAPVAAAPEKPEPGCFQVTYHHQATESHTDAETCGHHKNLITLKHTGVNFKSVCVRANGVAVAFEKVKGQNQVLVGPVGGPETKITVRYCLGKVTCGEDCTIPRAKRDEFMDAIGGSEDSVGGANAGQWEANADNGDVTAKIDAGIRKELADHDENPKAPPVFSEWIGDGETPVCAKPAYARNSGN